MHLWFRVRLDYATAQRVKSTTGQCTGIRRRLSVANEWVVTIRMGGGPFTYRYAGRFDRSRSANMHCRAVTLMEFMFELPVTVIDKNCHRESGSFAWLCMGLSSLTPFLLHAEIYRAWYNKFPQQLPGEEKIARPKISVPPSLIYSTGP